MRAPAVVPSTPAEQTSRRSTRAAVARNSTPPAPASLPARPEAATPKPVRRTRWLKLVPTVEEQAAAKVAPVARQEPRPLLPTAQPPVAQTIAAAPVVEAPQAEPTPIAPRRSRRAPRSAEAVAPIATVIPRATAVAAAGADVAAFRALGIGESTLRSIAALGFDTPTPIQEQAIPVLLTGRDVVGRAQTGTGKTLAFAVPIAERLDPALAATQAIVLVPTRELAEQVSHETARICGGRGLNVVPLIGGRRIQDDMAALRGRPQVVVGTPGRVIDHLRRGTLVLAGVRFVVLDEADEMLDIGFADDIETILRRTPRQRQTALFSATLPAFLRRMINRYLLKPAYVAIDPEKSTIASIEQVYYEVAERDKLDALLELLNGGDMQRVLCFRRTQIGVDRLASQLKSRGVSALGIHGGLSQGERDRVMKAFRAGELRVLIATNVAARGLDIPDVSHVVNFDLPQNTEEYVHRTGRTGRAGASGTAVTFISEWDYEGLPVLQKFVGPALHPGALKLYSK